MTFREKKLVLDLDGKAYHLSDAPIGVISALIGRMEAQWTKAIEMCNRLIGAIESKEAKEGLAEQIGKLGDEGPGAFDNPDPLYAGYKDLCYEVRLREVNPE